MLVFFGGVSNTDGSMVFSSGDFISHLKNHQPSGQIITTSAEVTLNGGLIRELPQNPRKIQV